MFHAIQTQFSIYWSILQSLSRYNLHNVVVTIHALIKIIEGKI